ncbi:MAG TPA: hypothetical protein VI636_18020 [Candidatus Angelobacter sp.]
MPRTVRADETQSDVKKPVAGQFIAEYSNYQKFDVSGEDKVLVFCAADPRGRTQMPDIAGKPSKLRQTCVKARRRACD